MLGSITAASGLGCVPNSPAGLTVLVNPGRLYSLQNLDNTAYGSLAPDTAHQLIKQGISLNPVTLSCPAPSTAGQSINYLIEATYSDVDTNNIVLPYYNSNNPSQTYSGPNNSNSPQATLRQGQIVLMAKPGTAAATGTQTTPAVDSGYLGLWVVTVANGAATIVSGNISLYSASSFMSPVLSIAGSFTLTATGFSGAPAATAYWRIVGNQVTLVIPSLSGTSNATTFTATGLPAAIQPAAWAGSNNFPLPMAIAQNNSAYVAGAYGVIAPSSATITFGLLGNPSGWTASGTKSVTGVVSYALD